MSTYGTWATREAQEHYTLRDLAAILRMNQEHLRKTLIKGGRISYHRERPGGRILVSHSDLLGYLASIRVEATPNERTRKCH